jgi:hypothetical protein
MEPYYLLVLVEYLHEDKCIEHRCLNTSAIPLWENVLASKVQDERHCQLIDGLTDDHLPHCQSD